MAIYDIWMKDVLIDYVYAKCTIFDIYEPRIATSLPAGWPLPSRLQSLAMMKYVVKPKMTTWPDVLMALPYYGLIVSQRLADQLHDVPRSQAELFPVEVQGGRGSTPPPDYYLLNVCGVVDAVNLTAMNARHSLDRPPDMDHFLLDWQESVHGPVRVIDPDRVPEGAMIFTLKYSHGLFVAGDLGRRLKKANLSLLEMLPVRLRREDEKQRRALLARLRKEASAAPAPPKKDIVRTVYQLEKRLGLTLPVRARAFLKNNEAAEWEQEEFCDIPDAYTSTQELRNWEGLAWPDSMVAIAADGRGGYYALDTAKTSDGDCPVVYFDHELAIVDRKTGTITPKFELCAPTLDAWAERLAKGGRALPPRGKR